MSGYEKKQEKQQTIIQRAKRVKAHGQKPHTTSGIREEDQNNKALMEHYFRVIERERNLDLSSTKAMGNVIHSSDSQIADDLELQSSVKKFDGTYESNPKHDVSRLGVSPQPINPEKVLAISILVDGNSNSRIGYDRATQEIVMFQNHEHNKYHGYMVAWEDLRQKQKNALINANIFKPNGKLK